MKTNREKAISHTLYSFSLFLFLVQKSEGFNRKDHNVSFIKDGLVLTSDAVSTPVSIDLRKIKFLNESFYVWKKSDVLVGDAVDFVMDGINGEGKISKIFQQKASECSHSKSNKVKRPIVLDIGANGGIYGLYASKMGCHSLFFEIQPTCIRNIFYSIQKNNFQHHAHVIPHPVGNISNKILELDQSSHCFGVYRVSTGSQHEAFQKIQKEHSKFNASIVRIDDVFQLDNINEG